MTVSPKVWNFPTFPIQGQLFHSPGAGYDGGFTTGGVQVISPEPGGFGVLEIEPSVILTEWDYPLASWLMSKVNGQVMRIRLAPSPQVAYSKARGMAAVPWDTGLLWSNQEEWDGDFTATFAASSLKGTTQVTIDLTGVGPIVTAGHVIGHEYECYLIDEITYDGDIGYATVTPPLARNVTLGDGCPLRPWFTGRISNGADFRSPYTAQMVGHVKLGNIVFHQAIVP